MERRDLDDIEARLRHQIREEARQTRLELGEKVRSVGMWPAVLGAIVASLLTTGAVMFMWGIFR
jgi:DNA-binding Lrp family transcriptional regulator